MLSKGLNLLLTVGETVLLGLLLFFWGQGSTQDLGLACVYHRATSPA
jgi:hypothetical protein